MAFFILFQGSSAQTTSPSIAILVPDTNATTRSNIIYGKVSDDAVKVTVNDLDIALLPNNFFIARPSLTEGSNTATVKAWDASGNLGQSQITFSYNTTTPKVTITSPIDNSVINMSPIKVEGTYGNDLIAVVCEGGSAQLDNNRFIVESINLNPFQSVITATGYDSNNNAFCDSVYINSPELSDYVIMAIPGPTDELPIAGSVQTLKIKLTKNNQPAVNEEVQFKVIKGSGALSQARVFTDTNGEAQSELTTDTNCSVVNKIESFVSINPLAKASFDVSTNPGLPSQIIKITDESVTPMSAATIPLIVKLTDQYNNPIQDGTINFQITQGIGTLSSPTAITNYYGEAQVDLTCPSVALSLTRIKVSLNTNPSLYANFNITTSNSLKLTVDKIMDQVNKNDSKINDMKADITMTSNAPFLPPLVQLKIWQKADKQKVQEISPNPQVKIRPPLQTSTEYVEMQREMISYDDITSIYVIKTKQKGQVEEYPYQLDYVDYEKGVVKKTEYYSKENDEINLYAIEDSDFVKIKGIWIFTKETKTFYKNLSEIAHTTTSVYSNIQVNTRIPDGEFLQ